MAPKKNYSRYFIILQEDEKGYAQDNDKTPSGYVKLEKKNNKCKISYYVQNLNKSMQPYYMVLVCGKKDVKKVIKVGKLNIDDYGRVDICNEYDINNIANSGISMDKINGAAIAKIIDNNIISIMSGFSSSDAPKDWRNYPVVKVDREEKVEEKKANVFDEYEKNIEKVEVNKKENKVKSEIRNESNKNKVDNNKNQKEVNKAESKKEVNEEVRKELKKQVRDGVKEKAKKHAKKDKVKEEDKVNEDVREELKGELIEELKSQLREEVKAELEEQIKSEIKEKVDKEVKVIKDQDEEVTLNRAPAEKAKKDYPTGHMGEFFKGLVEDFEEIPNMAKGIKVCRWYKIPAKNIESMYDTSDYDKYTVVYYPMLCYYSYIQKYGYYALGYKSDNEGKLKYLVYGIPGTKSKEQQPFGGKTGFVTWIPSEDDKDMGYWLMFYDIKNSTVVIPVKK